MRYRDAILIVKFIALFAIKPNLGNRIKQIACLMKILLVKPIIKLGKRKLFKDIPGNMENFK